MKTTKASAFVQTADKVTVGGHFLQKIFKK